MPEETIEKSSLPDKTSSLFDLTGKTVLVTGGGTGLGLAITRSMVKAGARVIITGRRADVLENTCRQLGEKVSYRAFDLSQLDRIPAFVDEIEASGPIHVLINNAGINLKKDILDVTDEEFETVIKINQTAVFTLTREIARKMEKRGKGSIILISSMAAKYGIPKVIAYTAAKSAVEGMTRSMAVDLSPRGIRVNCIAPGFIETAMSAKALNNDPERKNRVLSRTPMGYLGQPEDVGLAAVYLASDAARYVTGVILPVDGGNSIGF
ncbi:SDR family oxidoreductase [Puia sp.]|uniref:SDR family NAD(P)-dependent oxidoreductase n=1 Tax=Puia sp. TaxID=2045100 RepID=UPI002F3EFD02